MSRQITWMYYSMANQGMFSHLDSSVQRLPNGNTLISDAWNGRIVEVTRQKEKVWEYKLRTDLNWIYRAERVPWAGPTP